MNKWSNFKNQIDSLVNSNKTNIEIESCWKKIQINVKNYEPNHLINLFDIIKKYKLHNEIKILDHGCGDGLTLFFLAAKGYENIWGIDVNNSKGFNKRKKINNKILKVLFKKKSDSISNYDGKVLPYKNASFDFIFSQQVIEHIEEKSLDHYLSEEARVLKNRGFALHQIPHRLGPFEGHTKKWFIHWLPKNIYHYLLKKDKAKLSLVKNALFLKWPWELKISFKKYFSSVKNISINRLKVDINSDEYSLKEKIIRKALVILFRIPLAGKLFLILFSVFFQLEFIVQKKN